MSQRLQIVIADPVGVQLHELAGAAGEPVATLAARIVRDGVTHAGVSPKRRLARPSPPVSGTPAARPAWLEPYGGDPVWWREMWGAIVALHGRYPRHLEYLRDGWWEDEATAETLCAVAVWRAEIDEHGRDPREEIAFHDQLADIAHSRAVASTTPGSRAHHQSAGVQDRFRVRRGKGLARFVQTHG